MKVLGELSHNPNVNASGATTICVKTVLTPIIPRYDNIILCCIIDDSDTEVSPETMSPGETYTVQYGTTQEGSSLGTRTRSITVESQGLSSETDFYREGRPVYRGVWVIDHSDNDRKKFFFHSRFIDIQLDWVHLV